VLSTGKVSARRIGNCRGKIFRVENSTLQQIINQLYDDEAEAYEAEPGHGIDNSERECWHADISAALRLKPNSQVLDVGSGTGIFSRLFADWGHAVTGLEPSQNMLRVAHATTLRQASADRVRFVMGDTHHADLFEEATYDCIVSRQVVCHFRDPLLVFQNWHRWLKHQGTILVVDGLWLREGWGNDELVDQLPLSCLQTRATLAYLLDKAGFHIDANRWLATVNEHLATTGGSNSPRYLVVAHKF
jgi:SAM-dependent methyltransferase